MSNSQETIKYTTKMISGNVYVPVAIEITDGRMYFMFGYAKPLMDEIKASMEGRKWHGYDEKNPRKCWSAPITQRNLFVVEYLKGKYGKNPYAGWSEPTAEDKARVLDYCQKTGRTLYNHQLDGTAFGLKTHRFLLAHEMGLGKSLDAIIIMEMSEILDWWWLGPKSALRALEVELRKWRTFIKPRIMTYESLKKELKFWEPGEKPPQAIICDESIKLKTPTAQRAIAVKYVADAMRDEWGDDCFIGLLSGAPATKSPADYWHQCEILCPGYLREGNIQTFKQRLGVIEEREQTTGGGVYPHLVTWRDDENKCHNCGLLESDDCHKHMIAGEINVNAHAFVKSKNEVAALYRRMKGLVQVRFKKDCLDLPEKIYDIIKVEPSAETLRAAQLIAKTSRRAIEALTRLRELSDGFQYRETKVGRDKCPRCNGTGKAVEYFANDVDSLIPADPDLLARGVRVVYNDDGEPIEEVPCTYRADVVVCDECSGTGEVDKYERTVIEVETPKEIVLREQLDLHDDIGRLNVYAGFTASVDRVVRIAHNCGWGTIRVDGRGWLGETFKGEILQNDRLLDIYQQGQNQYNRLVFVGQAGAAGMGLTLTAAPTTMFYSNDFNGDSRIQAEDRGHRIGMDVVRGGHILDIIHLPTDQYVLDNLQKKKDLQRLSLTGIINHLG